MLSTFHGIEVGKKGLMANNMGLQTTGHNLSNVETEGYSRQKVNLSATTPLYEPSANRVETAGQIGTGVEVEDIQRVRDQAIDDRINYEKGGQGFWDMKQQFLHQIEMIHNEPGKPNLRTVLDDYWESWQKVAADPTERAAREELVQRTQTVADTFQHSFNSLYDLRKNADQLAEQRVNEINNMASEIAPSIVASTVGSLRPGFAKSPKPFQRASRCGSAMRSERLNPRSPGVSRLTAAVGPRKQFRRNSRLGRRR